jgi:hypothetical protein
MALKIGTMTVAPDEAPSDGTTYGRKDAEWVDITAPANLQLNRGTASEVAAYTPLSGEPVWDETNKRLVVGDGATQGGVPIGASVGSYITTPANLSRTSVETAATLPGNGSLWSFEYQTVIGGNFRDYTSPYYFLFQGQGWVLGSTTSNPDGQYFGVLQYHSGSTFLTTGFSSVTNSGTLEGAPTSGLYTGPAISSTIAPIGDGRLAYCRISGTALLNSPSANFVVGLEFLWEDDHDEVIVDGCLQRSLVCRRVG